MWEFDRDARALVRRALDLRAPAQLARAGIDVVQPHPQGGIGAQAEARLGMGLHHIEARARRLRGNARIEAAPQHGTRVAVEFPHRA